MKNLKTQIQITMVLGILSLLGGGIGHLALTDIYHGEVDVSLEWNVLRIIALVFLAFTILTLFTLRRTLREFLNPQ